MCLINHKLIFYLSFIQYLCLTLHDQKNEIVQKYLYMKSFLTFIFSLIFLVSSYAQVWKLSWHDEFSKEGLPDDIYWSYKTGNQENSGSQYFTKARRQNVRVANQHLIIEARKDLKNNFPFSSAHLNTKNKTGR